MYVQMKVPRHCILTYFACFFVSILQYNSKLCENTETSLYSIPFCDKILFGRAKLTGRFLRPGNEDGKVTAVVKVCDVHQSCTVKKGPMLTLLLPSSVPPGLLRLVSSV